MKPLRGRIRYREIAAPMTKAIMSRYHTLLCRCAPLRFASLVANRSRWSLYDNASLWFCESLAMGLRRRCAQRFAASMRLTLRGDALRW
jgi:hypothetical protein